MGAGRKRIPVHSIESTGGNDSRHMSKEEIASRKAAEVSLGGVIVWVPKSIINNSVAHKKWKIITALYEGTEYINSADVDIIEDYCLSFSSHEEYLKMRRNAISEFKRQGLNSFQILTKMKATNVDNMILKYSANMAKLGNLLYLNPVSRANSLPVKPPEKPKSDAEQIGIEE